MFKFLLGVQDIKSTIVEKRISEVIISQAAIAAFDLNERKESPTKYAQAEDMFTACQKQYVLTKLFAYLEFFGYFKPQSSSASARYAPFIKPNLALDLLSPDDRLGFVANNPDSRHNEAQYITANQATITANA